MNIFDDVDAFRAQMGKEESEAHLLLLHGMTPVIDHEVETGAMDIYEPRELLSVGLIRDER